MSNQKEYNSSPESPTHQDSEYFNLHGNSTSQTELYLHHTRTLKYLHKKYSHLTTLVIIGQQELKSLCGIEHLSNLKELWVAECRIQETSPASQCSQLEKLYLYSNEIEHIPNFSACKNNLETLWLSGNKISCIENVEHLKALRELNLGNNNIYQIGTTLQHNTSLQDLNLSGNPLHCLKDLCHLNEVESLTSLRLADMMYGECPLVQLCNYRPYTVYHLSRLVSLDECLIKDEERTLVKEFYKNKIIHYKNCHQFIVNEYHIQMAKAEEENKEKMAQFREYLILYNLKEIQAQKYPDESGFFHEEHIKTRLAHIPLKVKKWLAQLSELKAFHQRNREVMVCQLNHELYTAGNVRFLDVTNDSNLTESCQSLMDNYLCSHTQRNYGTKGIKIGKIIHIRNKGLELLSDYMKNSDKNKSQENYMFMLLLDPFDNYKKKISAYDICEKGFVSMKEYTLKVTDCLGIVDSVWLQAMAKERSTLIYLPDEKLHEQHVSIIVKLPNQINLQRIQLKSSTEDPVTTIKENACKKEKSCSIYLVSKPKTVVPIFLVEYQYIIEDSIEAFKKKMGWVCDIHAKLLSPVSLPTYSILDKASVMLLTSNESNFETLVTLTLSGYGIRAIGFLPELPNVTTIDMSFNKMTAISGFTSFPNLKNLNLSFNSILSLEKCEGLPNLVTLNISWNKLQSFVRTMKSVQQNFPKLQNLNIKDNPFDITDTDHVLVLAHRYLPNVQIINEIDIGVSFLPNKLVIDLQSYHSFVKDKTIPLTLLNEKTNLKWKVDICNKAVTQGHSEKYEDVNMTVDCSKWISLSEKQIVSIKASKHVANTLWADFSKNLLDDLSFLENCVLLKELSISQNVIQDPGSSLHHLRHLVKLDLSCNYLTNLKAFCGSRFPTLKVLNVSKNWITDLMGIENCEALVEFYASHNHIHDSDDLHYVQNCKDLKIIDISNNPVELSTELHKFIVFNLPKLKMLNCFHVNAANLIEAYEKYGGCLDQEFLLRQHTTADLKRMTELTLTRCLIKKINLSMDLLPNLKSLDLQHNKITTLWDFCVLPSLVTLCLSYNQVMQMKTDYEPNEEKKSKLFFPKLETLFLNKNNIFNLEVLHLSKLRNLHTLFLHDNQISCITGLQGASSLKSLVIGRNKLECVNPKDFPDLRELYIEENKIKHLNFTRQLKNLQRLLIGLNEISDLDELKHLTNLNNLKEIEMMGNPISQKRNYYQTIVQYIPSVTSIDGIMRESDE